MGRQAVECEAVGRDAVEREERMVFGSGSAALQQVAPRPARALAALERGAWRQLEAAGRLDLFDLAARVVAVQHGLPPLARPRRCGEGPWTAADAAGWRGLSGPSAADRSALAFAEQLAFDVASVGPDDRKALFDALGSDAVPFVQAVYVADFVPRVRRALDALFGAGGQAGPAPADEAADFAAAFDALLRTVPGLQALDPVTTELVRLLGARRHRCRLCQSLRSRSALVAGADEATFAAVDAYPESGLSPARKAALAFAEAMIASPVALSAEIAAALRAHFEPAACVELVLDVARNATNKVAVALGADAPHVDSGVEVYDVTPDGELHYGLEAP